MFDPIVQLVQAELEWFQEVREQQRAIFPDQDNLYPIPFFGDIRRAEVLTLALNPANTEFSKKRHWWANIHPPEETAPSLTTRLLHYFDLPSPPHHSWFDKWKEMLLDLNCSYKTNAAHVDLHSLPTKYKDNLDTDQKAFLGNLIQDQSGFKLGRILSHAPLVKLIIVIDYEVPSASGSQCLGTFDYVRANIPLLGRHVAEDGRKPPIFRGGRPDQVAICVFEQRSSLREFLHNAQALKLHD